MSSSMRPRGTGVFPQGRTYDAPTRKTSGATLTHGIRGARRLDRGWMGTYNRAMTTLPGAIALALLISISASAATGNEMAMSYLRAQAERIEAQSLDDLKTDEGRERRRKEALEMFGLSPMPERGELRPVVTKRQERDGIAVENLHFQSSPGLYVTANFYTPAKVEKKLPTVLYVCGHSLIKTNGISYGNKVGYQHHGIWFARHGYACLVIDTIQLGEIEGIHHGTYREGMWWWNSRGYSSAAAEAWNSIRALDYLETRPEVDKEKFAVTGRSGGGAYSWSLIALDPRVKVAAPVAGITDLRNHVIDGTVEGHCDCMFFVNTYGWDYPALAALAAPRPLLIVNTDSDTIFPLDGVIRTHKKVADIYASLKASPKLGLVIGPGGHKDTQDIQVPVFRWFNQHLRGEDPAIEKAAERLFAPQDLKVFDKNPADERVTRIHEWFVPKASKVSRDELMTALKKKVFRNWPQDAPAAKLAQVDSKKASDGSVLDTFELQSDEWTRLKVFRITQPRGKEGSSISVIDDAAWGGWLSTIVEGGRGSYEISNARRTLWFVAPRGVGPTQFTGDAKTVTQLRRRFMLVGTTLDSMRVWDIRRAMEAIGPVDFLSAHGKNAKANLLLAAVMTLKSAGELHMVELPETLRDAADYLNILRFADAPELLALAGERHKITK